MNTYYKFCPNVFLAKCDAKHEKGEVIEVTTKYGKENESIVFNLVFEKGGFYYYSIVRADGFNVQEWAKRRAERRREWAASAERKSHEYYEKSNKDRDFLSLGEPIKVGHHSEKRHMKAIEDAWNNMGKSVELGDKATEHERIAKYWDAKADTINLSMPESIDQDQVESIVLSRYLYEDGEDQYLKKEYTSQEDIQKILPQATFGEGRFSVGSHMNYDVTCEIFWKDEEKENLVFSIFEDSSLTEILEQLNQANSD